VGPLPHHPDFRILRKNQSQRVRPVLQGSLVGARRWAASDAYDNAMAESFFATLECELLDRRRFKSQTEARMAVFEFIEGWYTPVAATQPWSTSPPTATKGSTRQTLRRKPRTVHQTGNATPRAQRRRSTSNKRRLLGP
jgi:hypothetical protein